MPEKLREDLQRKAEATLQVMPSMFFSSRDNSVLMIVDSQLPTLDNFHTLVALDTSHQKSATVFGFPGWLYKSTSSKNGKMYCLRRLEGERLSSG
jgi:PAB-dependent poly(A)-specific ribonuclease subunit 3